MPKSCLFIGCCESECETLTCPSVAMALSIDGRVISLNLARSTLSPGRTSLQNIDTSVDETVLRTMSIGQPADCNDFHANVFSFTITISPDYQKSCTPHLEELTQYGVHVTSHLWQGFNLYLLLQSFLDQSAAIAFSKALHHRGFKKCNRIARVPGHLFEMLKIRILKDSPFLVLGCKLHVEQVARQGGHHHICLLPLETYSSNFSPIKIHLDHVPILVDFVVRAEPLPTICRPAAHDGSYVFCSVVLFGHI